MMRIVRKTKRIFLVVLAMLACTECSKDHLLDCLKSTGRTVTVNRDASFISSIEMRQNVDVVIHCGTGRFIKVTAGENLVDGIITEVKDEKLYIRNENKCNWVRSFDKPVTVEVGLDTLFRIDDYGAGDLRMMDTTRVFDFTFNSWNASGSIQLLLDAGNSHINNHVGRTDIHASGFSAVSYGYINDTGTFDAYDLSTGYTYLRNSSTGFCKVFATKEIGAEVRYTGDVYYRGNPTVVHSEITGTGSFIKSD